MTSGSKEQNPYARILDLAEIDSNSSYAYLLELAGKPGAVLDVGCNTGYLGRLFMELGADVAGIDNDVEAVEEARRVGVDARVADLDVDRLPDVFPARHFDAIIFADVLEHLKRPDDVLASAAGMLAPGGQVLASIPNVAHGNVRLDLLLGRFEYTAIGLLDNTHLRFFTGETIKQLFADAGFLIERARRVISPVDANRIEEAASALGLPLGARDLLALLSLPDAETFQYIVSARPAADGETGEPPTFWTLGDRERSRSTSRTYLCVDEVPNVVADMRDVITGLETSLAENKAYLDTVIHDKDEMIAGLEQSLAETRAYLDTVIHDKDEMIAGLEQSLAMTRAYLDTVIQGKDEVIAGLTASLGDTRAALSLLQEQHAAEQRYRKMLTLPTVTVVVVNWNGEALLAACLSSLRRQTYPRERFQVVLVDNGSTDGSVEYVRRHFPEVTLIEAGSNVGFAAGNNLAISASESSYVALLNNDAAAAEDWLEQLVALAEADPTIGAVSSKIWLMHDRLVLSFSVTDTFTPGPHDPRRLGVKIASDARLGEQTVPVEFIAGAFGAEEDASGRFRWVTSEAEIRVPVVDHGAREVVITLLSSPAPDDPPRRARIRLRGEVVAETVVPASGPVDVVVPFRPEHTVPLVQNAGSIVLPNGAGSDRGTIVVGSEAFYDTDRGQFDRIEDVPAFCGAACLLRRGALEQVGSFDASFFMYYEDTDLSLRLRAAGWRVVYTPSARVRHHHSATSVEWSPRFCYFTERNRLLMLVRNGDVKTAVKEWAKYSARILNPVETPENRRRFLSVERSLARRLPSAIAARRRIRMFHGARPRVVFREPAVCPPRDGAEERR